MSILNEFSVYDDDGLSALQLMEELAKGVKEEIDPILIEESARKLQEGSRQLQESARQLQETSRKENEIERGNQEETRQQQEENRVTSEETRSQFYNGFSAQLAEKANKVQEAWITPTLLNGWTGDIKYRKNEDGMVVVSFHNVIVPATSAYNHLIFALPAGYRSGIAIAMFLIDNTGSGKPTESVKISSNCIVANLRVGATISGTVTFVGV